MSDVFSTAPHWEPKYLFDVVTHEQIGCAHLLVFVESLFFPPGFGSSGDDPGLDTSRWENMLLYRKKHIAVLVEYWEGVLERDLLAGESGIY
jgi:hypothetical protein